MLASGFKRPDFLRVAGLAAGALVAARVAPLGAAQAPAQKASTRPTGSKASEFVFARLRYDSGDWDYNPKVASNVLNSVVEYTEIPVYSDEVVIRASASEARLRTGNYVDRTSLQYGL